MKITFLGDIVVDENQIELYKNQEGIISFSGAIRLSSVLKDSDYVIANLETPVAGEEVFYTHDKCSFNSPESILTEIKEAGISAVITANNHCLDRGIRGLKKTIENLDKWGISHIGTYLSEKDEHILWLENTDTKVAIIAFTYGTNAFLNNVYLNHNQKYMVDLLQEQELSDSFEKKLYFTQSIFLRPIRKLMRIFKLKQQHVPVYERLTTNRDELAKLNSLVKRARNEGAKIVGVCLHVGGQYNSLPSKMTEFYSDYCKNIGCDFVIANHEHVIQKIKVEDEKFQAYSLGNCLTGTGVTCPPYDTLSQYSLSVTIECCGEDIKNVVLSILINELDDMKRLFCQPVYDYILKCKDEGKKQSIIRDVEIMLNRVFDTDNVKYEMRREYEVSCYGK